MLLTKIKKCVRTLGAARSGRAILGPHPPVRRFQAAALQAHLLPTTDTKSPGPHCQPIETVQLSSVCGGHVRIVSAIEAVAAPTEPRAAACVMAGKSKSFDNANFLCALKGFLTPFNWGDHRTPDLITDCYQVGLAE